jgi:hypothetical protein
MGLVTPGVPPPGPPPTPRAGTRRPLWLANTCSSVVCGVGPPCSFCGAFTGPFIEVEGLFTVLICIPCLAIRQASAGELLAFYDPGEPWLKWGCPIEGCGHRVIGPDELEGHTAAAHPRWVARYDLVRPYPDQLQAGRVPAWPRAIAGRPRGRGGLLYRPKLRQASLNCLAELSSASPSSAVTAASIARAPVRIAALSLTDASRLTSCSLPRSSDLAVGWACCGAESSPKTATRTLTARISPIRISPIMMSQARPVVDTGGCWRGGGAPHAALDPSGWRWSPVRWMRR